MRLTITFRVYDSFAREGLFVRKWARDCSGKPEVCWACARPDLERKARWPCVSLGHAQITKLSYTLVMQAT